MSSSLTPAAPTPGILPAALRLSWDASGINNLVTWIEKLGFALLSVFGIYADIIKLENVPVEWIEDMAAPEVIPAAGSFALELQKLQMKAYYDIKRDWLLAAPKMVAFIIYCCNESSILRVEAQHAAAFKLAIETKDPLQVFKLLKSSHTFRGSAASMEDQDVGRNQVLNFRWIEPETLPEFKRRWDLLMKRLTNLGVNDITDVRKLYRFVSALRSYGHSTQVQTTCMTHVAWSGTDKFPTDIEVVYESLVLLAGGQNSTPDSTPQLLLPSIHAAASVISGKIKKAGPKSSVKDPAPGTPYVNPRNTETAVYVQQQVTKTGKTDEEILSAIKCTKCGKGRHIAADCRMVKKKDEGGAKPSGNQPRRGKNNGGKLGSIFAADEDVSDIVEEEDDDFSSPLGFMISSVPRVTAVSKFDNHTCYSLDSNANVCVFRNPDLLTNIRPLGKPVTVEGLHGSRVTYDKAGDHPLFGRAIYDRLNKYNIVGVPRLHKLGFLLRLSDNNQYYYVVNKATNALIAVFERDNADGFYKCESSPPRQASAYPSSVIASQASNPFSTSVYYTKEQQARAQQAVALHNAMGHPSDLALEAMLVSPSLINCPVSAADLANARAMFGQCPQCLEGKPLPTTGNNSAIDNFEVTAAGQLLHMDIVFLAKVPFLFAVDDLSQFMSLVRLQSKSGNDLQYGLQVILNFYRSYLKVTQRISSDHEAVFIAQIQYLAHQYVIFKARIPYEHEKVAERCMRRVRESMRVKLLELPYRLAEIFLPYLAMHCVDSANFIPNARSMPLMPNELVRGEKTNFRTDILAIFGQLVLVETHNVSTNVLGSTSAVVKSDPHLGTVKKNEFAIALGHNTPRSVWVYRKGASRIVPRRPIKASPMSDDWINFMNALADKKAISVSTMFEFRETQSMTADELLEGIHASRQPSADGEAPIVSSVEDAKCRIVATGKSQQQMPTPTVKPKPFNYDSSVQPDYFSEEPEPTPPEPIGKPASIADAYVQQPAPIASPGLRRSTRTSKPPDKLLFGMESTPSDEWMPNLSYYTALAASTIGSVKGDTSESSPVRALHEIDVPVVMAISLEQALKTQYQVDVEAAAVKECGNLVKYKTWTYLRTRDDAEKSVHTNLLPCSMIVKDKRDTRGMLLSWKARLTNGGHRTDPTRYLPFDKSSPTANIDAVYAFLAVMQHYKMHGESSDVPSAYLNAPLKKGYKHVMKIGKTLSKYVCLADPSAIPYLQSDGTLLVQLERALYGLPESGKLWHEFLSDALRKSGYEVMEGNTCIWRRLSRDKKAGLIGVSFILIYVDDLFHIYKGKGMREYLYAQLTKHNLPNLTVHPLTAQTPISFLGLSIEIVDGRCLYVSQPGYIAAMVSNFEYGRKRSSPLPSDFNSRKLTDLQSRPLTELGKSEFLKMIMSLAWLVRTRIDIHVCVSHLQTRCQEPRAIDMLDLRHIIGYLATTPNLGIRMDVIDMQPYLYVDVGHATHPDRKSHEGALVTLGINGPPIIWKSGKQKIVATSSTEAELIGVSDYADLILVTRRLLEFLRVDITTPLIVFQDNTSTITVAYLGRPSIHARRRFIDIRFFWIKQFLDNSTFELQYLPTESMLADFLASVRSGAAFKKFRVAIMGA